MIYLIPIGYFIIWSIMSRYIINKYKIHPAYIFTLGAMGAIVAVNLGHFLTHNL